MTPKDVWLEGYYPPRMDDWISWQGAWSMGPHAEPDWVWFRGDYYTEAEARGVLERATDEDRAGDNPVPRCE
jgi:hypothetical protein